MKRVVVGVLLCLAVAAGPAAQSQLKYGVTVTTSDKTVDLTKLKTYSWFNGQPAPNKTIDAQIVAAVDRELKALGMTKADPGPGDALVTYFALRRTDSDMKSKPDAQGGRALIAVGTLSVGLFNPGTKKEIVRLRLDKPIDTDPAQSETMINNAVTEMFAKYPTKKK
jgi:hypothetical protein